MSAIDPGDDETNQEISNTSLKCKRAFESYLSNPHTAYVDRVEVQQARFNMWASNIGVFATLSASLDQRLREYPEIKVMILRMLEVMHSNILRGIAFNPH